MPPKKRIHKDQARRLERVVQLGALLVLLVVVGMISWSLLPKEKSTACRYFDAVPAADQYDEPPPMLIDLERTYQATIALEKGGDIIIDLLPAKAPNTVNNFIFLACNGFTMV